MHQCLQQRTVVAHWPLRIVRLSLLILPFLLGCGPSGPKMLPIGGAVTIDGKPMADGLIAFKTIQTGDIETMKVKEGRFGGNVKEGDRRVEIYMFGTKKGDFNGMPMEFKSNVIPPRYSSASTLTAKVTGEGPNQFTFDIQSK